MPTIRSPTETCRAQQYGDPCPHDFNDLPLAAQSLLTVFLDCSLFVRCAAALFLSLFCFRPLEPIPHPGFRQNIFRMRRILLDLLSQLIDHYTQVLGFLAVLRAPHGLQ